MSSREVTHRLVTGQARAMASTVTVQVVTGPDDERAQVTTAIDAALEVFHDVDRTCTRFDANSDLMRANADPQAWHEVSFWCLRALAEAHAAYRRTGGRFDPRVYADLVRLGYDRSMSITTPIQRSPSALKPRAALPTWQPEFRRATGEVRVGTLPVDLGGIGKGLAVRWASERLHDVGSGHLVEAGGDCRCVGRSPEGAPWRVAVEDPSGGADPVAVLGVVDQSVATSSVRLRSWDVAGVPVHHLIDPVTGRPGGQGLLAVTVIDDDPAAAEVSSKCLFLAGARGIAVAAFHDRAAALWVDVEGRVAWSLAMDPYLEWVAA